MNSPSTVECRLAGVALGRRRHRIGTAGAFRGRACGGLRARRRRATGQLEGRQRSRYGTGALQEAATIDAETATARFDLALDPALDGGIGGPCRQRHELAVGHRSGRQRERLFPATVLAVPPGEPSHRAKHYVRRVHHHMAARALGRHPPGTGKEPQAGTGPPIWYAVVRQSASGRLTSRRDHEGQDCRGAPGPERGRPRRTCRWWTASRSVVSTPSGSPTCRSPPRSTRSSAWLQRRGGLGVSSSAPTWCRSAETPCCSPRSSPRSTS